MRISDWSSDVCSSDLHLRFLTQEGLVQTDPAYLADEMDADDWHALSAGEGAKGARLYHWARLPLNWTTQDGFERWLLFRRSLRHPGELAYYFEIARASCREKVCKYV